jgi:hypothetical protein
MSEYDPAEQEVILETFCEMLRPVVEDGGRKRAAGDKVPWTADPGHADALMRHLVRYDRGEMVDGDSGAHPLVHAAFRCLALAYQDEQGPPLEWC